MADSVQTVFRSSDLARTGHFTMLPNDLCRSKALSLGATGLLVHLLSYPKNWQIHMTVIQKEVKEGKQRFGSLKSELEEHGYIRRIVQKDANGKVVCHVWQVTDTPWTFGDESTLKESTPQVKYPESGLPESGNPESGFVKEFELGSGTTKKPVIPTVSSDSIADSNNIKNPESGKPESGNPTTTNTDLQKEINTNKKQIKTDSVFQVPPDLVEYTELLNDWIRYRQEKTRLTKKNEYTSIAFERDCNKIRCTKQNNVSLAEVTKVVDQAINAGWVTFYIDKLTSKQTKPVTTKPDFDFIPNASMAVPKVSPRDALVAKYGGKDVYMRLEEDGPIYITALHKADGVTGGLNDDYMVELWVDGKPRYIDYAEVESLMTTKEEYESWNAFLNLF